MINRQRIKQFRREEITLLIDSNILNDYPALKKLITEKPDLRDEDIEDLSPAEKLALDMYSYVAEVAANEWADIHSTEFPVIRAGESPEHSVCELCGSTQCLDLYPIANHDNSKVLYVGSTCIQRFVPQGRKNVTTLAQRRSELRKYAKLIKYFPGIYEKFVASGTKSCAAASDLPYLVVDPLYQDAENSFKALRDLCHRHQETDEQDIEPINILIRAELENYSRISAQLNDYLRNAGSNWLIPTRAMIDRLKTYGEANVLNRVRKEGCINEKTLSKFDELLFLESSMLPRIQALTNGSPLTIIGVAEKKGIGGYMAEFKASHAQVFIPHASIASSKAFASELIAGKHTQRFRTIMSLCRIVEETDFSALLRHAQARLNYYHYRPIGIDMERNEVFFKVSENYKVIPLDSTIQRDIVFFGSPEGSNPVHLAKAFEKAGTDISYKEWVEILSDRSRAAFEL